MKFQTGYPKPFIFLLLAGLLAAVPAWAGSWHGLHGSEKGEAPASLTVESKSERGLTLKAHFPGFRLGERHHPLAGDYVAPEITGCGISETIGAPERPVLRRLIIAPTGATLKLAVTGSPRMYMLRQRPTQAFYPRQRPRPKGSRSSKMLPFDFDVSAYAKDHFSPEPPCRLTEAGIVKGQRFVLVEVFPAAVNPITQGLRLFPSLTITVEFENGTAAAKGTAPSPGTAPADWDTGLVLNAESAIAEAKAPTRLLIIGPEAWMGALAPLISHRQSRGWSVDTLTAQAAGGTATAIRSTIRTRYQNTATRPGALLLIGDVAQVPCFEGTQVDKPDTDLYYACMDGSTDWQPEFPVGRLSVSSASSLADVIAKIVVTETSEAAPWMTRAAFMAGEDNHAITEGTHNAVIANHMEPRGFQCDKLYSESRNATTAQVKAALNEGRLLGVYSGHGDTGLWADGPAFYKSDVQSLSNQGRYPVIFSFACLTGQFGLNECFAETWLRQPDKAACGVFASSVTSFWDEDDILERRIFNSIFEEGLHHYGDALLRAKFRLIEEYGLTSTTRRYFEQYNFFGDPAATLREPALSIRTASPLPTGHVGTPYSVTLRGAGGREPYAWSLASPLPGGLTLHSASGLLSGTPLVPAENLTVTVRLTDADQTVVTGQFQLDITVDTFRITGGTDAGPFQAGTPFTTTLTAKGGVGALHWSFQNPGQFQTIPGKGKWVNPATAMNWQGDEQSWKIRLPWAFRFFGSSYTSLWVNSNGYLDFGSKASQWNNSTEELKRHPRIAPLWDDLRTANVFVSLTANRLVIRWVGATFTAGYPVDFEAILKKNGNIMFVYRKMGGRLSPTSGISAGDGSTITLSRFNGRQSFSAGETETFIWVPPLSAGVTLSPQGVLSGMVATPLVRTATVLVRDSSTPARSATADVTLRVE